MIIGARWSLQQAATTLALVRRGTAPGGWDSPGEREHWVAWPVGRLVGGWIPVFLSLSRVSRLH